MKKNKKSSHAGMVHVNHDMFTNKDGFPNGGVEIETTKADATQSVQVRGTKKMLSEKKKVADWF